MRARRLLFVLLPLLFVVVPAAQAQDQWALLNQPRAIVLFRHASAPGSGDPAGFVLGDCATQRNLDERGRAQARALDTLSNWTGPGVLVAVTHQVNITALNGVSPSEGEGVIVTMQDGLPTVMGRLPPPG